MGRLFLASLFTLSVLSAFVFGLIISVLLFVGQIDFGLAIGLTIGINFIFWLIGPEITDFINQLFYKVRFVSKEEFEALHPEAAHLISQISEQYKFSFPKVGIIPDQNPTAFTYGSGRFNARIVVTEGLFRFLTPPESRAVVAHELGHIVHRDFIVMTIASTLVQIIYEIYAVLSRGRGGDKKSAAKTIAFVAYILYIVGIYFLYYLSRTREYLADSFASKVADPNDLSNALMKVAYGIVAVRGEGGGDSRLLQSTRQLGIVDVKNAKHYGIVSYISHEDPMALSEVMVFDKVNPWAKVVELSSTHPLTGKRISHLGVLAKEQGRPFLFDVDAAEGRMNINKDRLYFSFFAGLLIMSMPYLLTLISLFFLSPIFLPAAFGVGLLLQLPYRFPGGDPKETTVFDSMRDPYASPFRGKPISLDGRVVGRGIPGYIFGEDLMFQDATGLIFLNYSSAFGFIGNLFFALKKVKSIIGESSRASGWFYRGIGSMVSLSELNTGGGRIASHPILQSLVLPIFLIGVSLYFYVG